MQAMKNYTIRKNGKSVQTLNGERKPNPDIAKLYTYKEYKNMRVYFLALY